MKKEETTRDNRTQHSYKLCWYTKMGEIWKVNPLSLLVFKDGYWTNVLLHILFHFLIHVVNDDKMIDASFLVALIMSRPWCKQPIYYLVNLLNWALTQTYLPIVFHFFVSHVDTCYCILRDDWFTWHIYLWL